MNININLGVFSRKFWVMVVHVTLCNCTSGFVILALPIHGSVIHLDVTAISTGRKASNCFFCFFNEAFCSGGTV